ncbi:MAG: DUF4412 domain-containing protein [Firmicutes bacterium]|nr:DUF4412 domain-containing protein [Bacillota bacterium]
MFSRISKRFIAVTLTLLLIFHLAGTAAPTKTAGPEFSGEMTTTDAQGNVIKAKIFIKTMQKLRQEIIGGGDYAISIFRLDKKVSWILIPKQKQYMEVAFTVDPNRPNPAWEYTAVALGSQTINGYECKGTRYVYKDKTKGAYIQWMAAKLQYPVKIQHVDANGKVVKTLECSNIKPGPQPDSLFEVPKGYTLYVMPSMQVQIPAK